MGCIAPSILPDQIPYVLRLVKATSFSLYDMAEYSIATSCSCLSVTRKTSRLKVGIKERSSLFFFILIKQAQTASICTSSTLSTRTHNFLTHPTPHTISTRSSQSSSTTSKHIAYLSYHYTVLHRHTSLPGNIPAKPSSYSFQEQHRKSDKPEILDQHIHSITHQRHVSNRDTR